MTPRILLRNATLVTSQGVQVADLETKGRSVITVAPRIEKPRADIEIECEDYFVYPGLINSHDHLEFNLYPRLGQPPYNNSYEWGQDLQKRYKSTIEDIERIPLRDRLWWGAWKNLFSGVTRVVHHNEFYSAFHNGFPIEVLRRYAFAHSLRFEKKLDSALNRRKAGLPFIIHLSEGTDEIAASELTQLMDLGGLNEDTVLVHAVGLTERDIKTVAKARSAIVWCPSSNLYLFDKSAPVAQFNEISFSLGTDSTLTGSVTMFDELKVARSSSGLSPIQLFKLITEAPRRIFHFPLDAGTITEGGRADLFAVSKRLDDPYSQLIDSSPADILFLLYSGQLVFADRRAHIETNKRSNEDVIVLGNEEKTVLSRGFSKSIGRIRPYLEHYEYLTRTSKRTKSALPPHNRLVCPSCKHPIRVKAKQLKCHNEQIVFPLTDGIPDLVLPRRRKRVDEFVSLYIRIRQREVWGSDNVQYYLQLPYQDATRRHSDIWKIRSRTYDVFIDLLSGASQNGDKVLDLGAGNCWLSRLLTRKGFQMTAVDLTTDDRDGLGVAKMLREIDQPSFQCIRAEFDFLPFSEESFDHIIFNASLHYSENPIGTVTNVLKHLKQSGTLWILDSPIYSSATEGQAMVRDRIREFRESHHIEAQSDQIAGYLTRKDIHNLGMRYHVEFIAPSYGFSWYLRPFVAQILRRREPAQFGIIRLQK